MLYQVAGYGKEYQGPDRFGHQCHMGFFRRGGKKRFKAIEYAKQLAQMPDYHGMYFVVYECGPDYERVEIFSSM